MSTVRVFHCDDSPAFRLLVREMLRDYEGIDVIGEAATLEEALASLPDARADVVLVDLLEGAPEDELVDRLRAVAPDSRFLVYSGMPERTGGSAEGHLHKSATFEELHRVIGQVAAGA